MKIEQALVLYLLKNKQISLQGIGNFKIEGSFPETMDNEKPVIIPPEAISFTYNPKGEEEPDLIDFLVVHTKKIKPLASADLDSFLTLGRQFLNIGKPFTIQNLGTLEKLKSGMLEFRPGPLIQRVETPQTKIEDEGAEPHEENMFHEYGKENTNNRKALVLILIIILLVAGTWAGWHYGFSNKANEQTESNDNNIVPVLDSSASTDSARMKDSVAAAKKINDSTSNDSLKIAQKNITDSVSFNVVVFQTSDKDSAMSRFSRIKKHGTKVIMYTDDDSITFKIAHQFRLPLKDTTKLLDSLNRHFYRGKAHLELR